MSRCNNCSPGRGCCDFSSKADQLPSLAAIDVVEGLLMQAVHNSARRAQQVLDGELSEEDARAADRKLIAWLTCAFAGENDHFQSGENWNPAGLSDYLREVLAGHISEAMGAVPEEDREVIAAAAHIFVADLYALMQTLASRGAPLAGIEQTEPFRGFVSWWAAMLTGMPVDD